MTTETATPGAKVRYHGSIERHHGAGWLVDLCICPGCRELYDGQDIELYELEMVDGTEIRHVRRSSFTVEEHR